jgi:hypothetical protein
VFLIANERTKLTANWLNALATALVAAGVFAPAAALLYGLSQLSLNRLQLAVVAAGCFLGGAFLHWLGRLVLGRLRE